MNKRQKDILEFLALTDPSEFITQKVIAKKLSLSESVVGSECAKLSKDDFLQQDGTHFGEPLRYRISTKGQNYLDDEIKIKENLSSTKKLALATVGLFIVTAILSVGTIGLALDSKHQTELAQQDFDINNRPWIGVQDFDYSSNDKIRIIYTNFGNIPNTEGTVFVKWDDKSFTRDFVNTSLKYTDKLGVVLPDQIKHEDVFFPNTIAHLLNNNTSVYLGFVLKYNYGDNKQGEFGFIEEYNPQTKSFNYIDNWAN